MTGQNVIRATSVVSVIVLFVLDYGLDVLAKDIPKEVYFGLLAVALGIDIKGLRAIILRLLGVKSGETK